MLLRDRDKTGDGTLEERRYVLQNWRADVIALTTNAGEVLERVRYDAYGRPFRISRSDLTDPSATKGPDGAVDASDLNTWLSWSGASDARADLTGPAQDGKPDGVVDASDTTYFFNVYSPGAGKGRGTLSAIGNTRGYAGYVWDPIIERYHVRNRVYDAELGRWTKRDPLGFVDGANVYEYVRSMPGWATDPYGLCTGSTCSTRPLPAGNSSSLEGSRTSGRCEAERLSAGPSGGDMPDKGQLPGDPLASVRRFLMLSDSMPGSGSGPQPLACTPGTCEPEPCRFRVRCNSVAIFGQHCGLEMCDKDGCVYIDGSGSNINRWIILPVPTNPLDQKNGTYWAWMDRPPSDCRCARYYTRLWNGMRPRIPRADLQFNSNWSLRCLLRRCRMMSLWTASCGDGDMNEGLIGWNNNGYLCRNFHGNVTLCDCPDFGN